MEGDTNNAEGGRPVDDGQPDAEPKIRSERIAESEPYSKLLLDNDGVVWAFKVTQGRHTYYTVESQDRCWRFSLEYSARAKFSREVKRRYGGGL